MTGGDAAPRGPALAERLDAERAALAADVTARHYRQRPELAERYGPAGRAKCEQDAAYHLRYLAAALRASSEALFADYVAWARRMLAGRGIAGDDLALNLACVADAVAERCGDGAAADVRALVEHALADPLRPAPGSPELLVTEEGLAGLARAYLEALLRADRRTAGRLVGDAVERGVSVKDLYLHVFQATQHEVGRLWERNEISVAQEHFCTAATQLIMSQLYPRIFNERRKHHRLVATSVASELHEIGGRMVADFCEMDGWDTYYLGANTPPASVLGAVRERDAHVLAISATMTFHVGDVMALIRALRADPELSPVRALVGGYPFNLEPSLWRTVGADGWAPDALRAVEAANALVESGP